MKFILNGPDIPDRLLQAHEDGKVVFFAGSGISMAAGLPSFSGLVEKLFEEVGVEPSIIQKSAIKNKQFDAAINLLEIDITGGRYITRQAVAKLLLATLSTPESTATHEALLLLGTNRKGQTRLVTTNFDHQFIKAKNKLELSIKSHQAPYLPIPKNHWDGLVYLHGLLPSDMDLYELDKLILSSGDFGIAYLSERWAARFVSELFRNFTICFVGYSINDPVMRYMMDALAADRLRGESPPEVFAFGSHQLNKELDAAARWQAKNVTPILYREYDKHYYLRKTLQEWSKTYRDALHGKEQIITQFAMTQIFRSTQQEDIVGKMRWALSDTSGLPAKFFAELNPAPSLDWLDPLSGDYYPSAIVDKFGSDISESVKNIKTISLLNRPTLPCFGPQMALVSSGRNYGRLDDVMYQLARWLTRHLNDPKLLLWITKQGGQLHPDFSWLIEQQLHKLDQLVEIKSSELSEIYSHSPNAIPSSPMRSLWNLVLSGKIKSSNDRLSLYSWMSRFKTEGLTIYTRMELRRILTPQIILREPYKWNTNDKENTTDPNINELVNWDLKLAGEDVHYALKDMSKMPEWQKTLPLLLPDLNLLLRDAMDMMRDLGRATDLSDKSYIDQPSIAEHDQNRDFEDWTALIELVRDSWLIIANSDSNLALLFAQSWFNTPYPLFKRLAFFAATHIEIINDQKAFEWLFSDDSWWVWSTETQHESIRLMIERGKSASSVLIRKLEQIVLQGPPREMFRENLTQDRWQNTLEYSIWHLLAKLHHAGINLSSNALMNLNDLNIKHPEWEFEKDDRDEFPFWMSSGDEWSRTVVFTPKLRRDLAAWLQMNPEPDMRHDDNWTKRCLETMPTAVSALISLAQQQHWPATRWGQGLGTWNDPVLAKRSWRRLAKYISAAPDNVILKIALPLSRWLQALSKDIDCNQIEFFNLISRILNLQIEDDTQPDNDPIHDSINHPIGQVTEALINWWYKQTPKDNQGLPDEVRSRFADICDTKISKFKYGRLILAAHTISLFRVDKQWTEQFLLQQFDWNISNDDAHNAWSGFLWSPRLYRPLLSSIKQPFLDTAKHYDLLGKEGKQYSAILTFASLDKGDTFTTKELITATHSLPTEALNDVSLSLVHALQGAGDKKGEYCKNRILPYLKEIWPKSRNISTTDISYHFAQLCIAADSAFPDVFHFVKPWLKPVNFSNSLISDLLKSSFCQTYPNEALTFIDAIVNINQSWPPSELQNCINQILEQNPKYKSDQKLIKILKYLRKHGIN